MTESALWPMCFMVAISVAAIASILIFRDAIQSKQDWLDQCVVQEWESTGERHVGIMDYCISKYRQTL